MSDDHKFIEYVDAGILLDFANDDACATCDELEGALLDANIRIEWLQRQLQSRCLPWVHGGCIGEPMPDPKEETAAAENAEQWGIPIAYDYGIQWIYNEGRIVWRSGSSDDARSKALLITPNLTDPRFGR